MARMARDREISGPANRTAWEASAASYVHDIPDVEALEWIDATHRVGWVAPLAGNENKLNEPTLDERRNAALEEAGRENKPVITRIVSLPGDGFGFIIYAPIMVNGQPDGFLAGIFKAETCLQRYLPPAVANGEAISVSEGAQDFYRRDAEVPPTHKDWVVEGKDRAARRDVEFANVARAGTRDAL